MITIGVCPGVMACFDDGESVFQRKPAPHLMRGGYRFA
jgi:hypothetical protein